MLDDAGEELLVVDPSAATVEELVAVATEADGELPEIRLVADDGVLKDVMDDFIVASNAADLVEAGTLSLRTSSEAGG
ncbi:DUF5821 family protein, partial [Halobium palmae]